MSKQLPDLNPSAISIRIKSLRAAVSNHVPLTEVEVAQHLLNINEALLILVEYIESQDNEVEF